MDLPAKIEFFAAIWRVMRDDNMSVEEVRCTNIIDVDPHQMPAIPDPNTFRQARVHHTSAATGARGVALGTEANLMTRERCDLCSSLWTCTGGGPGAPRGPGREGRQSPA